MVAGDLRAPSARRAPGRRTRPSTAATDRSWPATRPARSGTPRAPGPGCRTGCAAITSRCRSARIRMPVGRLERRGAERPGELAEPVVDRPPPTPAAGRRVSRSIGAIPPASGSSHQTPDELGDLLVERHPGDQVGDPVVHRRASGRATARSSVDLQGRGRTPAAPSVVSRVTCVSSSCSPAISATSIAIASCPICRIGCWTVVSGGCASADSGMLSKPDDRELAGDVDPELGGDLEGRQGGDVVGREDRGRRLGQPQQRPGRVARLLGVERTERQQRLVDRYAGRRVRLPVAALAQLRGDQVGAAGDHADPAVARGSAGGRRPSGRPGGCRPRPSAGWTGRCAGRPRPPDRRTARRSRSGSPARRRRPACPSPATGSGAPTRRARRGGRRRSRRPARSRCPGSRRPHP